MYAVIKAGTTQYKVSEGDQIDIDRIDGKEGDKVSFDQVLMVGGKKPVFGDPLVKGAKVEAVVKKHSFKPKILVFKFKRRKNYQVKRGHKQLTTKVEISKIKA